METVMGKSLIRRLLIAGILLLAAPRQFFGAACLETRTYLLVAGPTPVANPATDFVGGSGINVFAVSSLSLMDGQNTVKIGANAYSPYSCPTGVCTAGVACPHPACSYTQTWYIEDQCGLAIAQFVVHATTPAGPAITCPAPPTGCIASCSGGPSDNMALYAYNSYFGCGNEDVFTITVPDNNSNCTGAKILPFGQAAMQVGP
jgi:hypothetical protein